MVRIQEFRCLGVVLGYSYVGSPFVAAEDESPPPVWSLDYVLSAYPGRLAPHPWLDDGSSLYDLFGDGFSLLVTRGATRPMSRRHSATPT